MNRIIAEFRRLEEEIPQRDPGDRPQTAGQWTKEVLITFCKLGRRDLGCTVRATGHHPNRVPDECRDGDEFLYDASWLVIDNCKRIISCLMVAECEWGNPGGVDYDFQKLLLARAKVRVMVYWKRPRENQDETCDRLLKHVETFNGTRGDTYLLIGQYENTEGVSRYQFHRITDEGPGNPPKLKRL